MPYIPSPTEYVSSESQCDPNLTSDTDQSTSDGPNFPAWHRAQRLNGFSNAHSARNSPIQCFFGINWCGTAQLLESNPVSQKLQPGIR